MSDLLPIYLPGMQGERMGDRSFCAGLIEAGLRDSEIFDWPEHRWMLNNLRDRESHRRMAEELAGRIGVLTDRRVVLVGHSTGAMVILDTLEQLGRQPIEQAWLLNAAVSGDYDLRPALAGVRRLVNIYSPRDWLVLNVGTRLFGTADGPRKWCAGFSSFTGPGGDDPRLEQRCYDPAWLKAGHYGGHLGALLLTRFARDVIGPMILRTAAELENA